MTESLDARERRELCTLLDDLGPDAPTLCEGWRTADLAAHLVVRERDPRSGPGILLGERFPKLEAYTTKLMERVKAKGYGVAVDKIRTGPPFGPFKMPGLRTLINLQEYVVHFEDVRRANGLAPRTDRPDLDAKIWSLLERGAKLQLRGVKGVGVRLQWGEQSFHARKGDELATIAGAPVDLLLYLFGAPRRRPGRDHRRRGRRRDAPRREARDLTGVNASIREAVDAVAALDPIVAALVESLPPPQLTGRRTGKSRFEDLAEAICYQQLAGKAALAIWGRAKAAVGDEFTPEAVLTTGYDALRAAGFSNAKALSVLDLAAHVQRGDVVLDRIGRLDDDAIVRELTKVRGIGRWTAEMFLIFNLQRLDVWPVGDLAVRAGWAKAYDLATVPTPKVLDPLGDRFRPYRTIIAWYCWRTTNAIVPGA